MLDELPGAGQRQSGQPHDAYLSRYLAVHACGREFAEDYMGRVFAPHRLRSARPNAEIQLTHCCAKLFQSSLHFIDYGAGGGEVSIVVPDLGDDLIIEFPLSGSAEVSNGRSTVTIDQTSFIVAPVRGPYMTRMSDDYKQLGLQVPMGVIRAALAATGCEANGRPVAFEFSRFDARGTGRLLFELINLVCRELDRIDTPLCSEQVRSGFERALVSLILDLPHDRRGTMGAPPPEVSPACVGRAEEFMRSRLRDNIDIDDVVRAAGVSKRSLYLAFQRHKGSSPMVFLKSIRLEGALIELENADRNGKSVTEVATEFGFFHLSRFAQDFKSYFGRLPSEVIKRQTLVVGERNFNR